MRSFHVRGVFVLLGFLCLVASPASAQQAVAFAAGSHVETKFPLGDIAGKAHSLSFRFRMDYPNSMTGNMIGLTSTIAGFYQISKKNTDSGSGDPPTLEVKIGPAANPATAVYANIENLKDGFEGNKWYHVAMTVDASLKLRIYVNGKIVDHRKQKLSEPNDVQLPAAPWGSGPLRFGRTAPFEQFYGQLDNIAVWDHALSPAEVAQVMKLQSFNSTGSVTGLLAAWTFDGVPGFGEPKGPGAFWALRGPARVTSSDLPVGIEHKPTAAGHVTKLSLPVIGRWRITQGADSPRDAVNNSHRGYASFCLDMVRADAEPTEGQPVLAAADGTVVMVRNSTPDKALTVPGCTKCTKNPNDGSCAYYSNELVIKHAPGEYTQYLHFMEGSVPSWVEAKLKTGEPVKRGRMIGRAGQSGAPAGPHLHVCMGWATFFQPGPVTASGKDEPAPFNILDPSSCGYKPAVAFATGMERTRPFEFSDYVLETGSGEKDITVGTPQLDEVVRAADRAPVFIDGFPVLSIQAMHSDKCAQVNGASAGNGATISQWDCVDQQNVRWRLVDAGDQHVFIKAQHSGKCMQVAGASHDNGAPITQWECGNQDHFRWKVERVPPLGYYLRAKHSGKCAHVQGGSTVNGGIVAQWDCFFQDNLRWLLQP
jgi:murein DD-endopeptidase MepM/ murein hydrolase activator NlpD